MTPEQEQALKEHLQAIAKILYDESDPATMQMRTPLGEESEWKDDKAIATAQGVLANFQNNAQLAEELYSIGSGAVESAIKQIGRRVQLSGAQWNRDNVKC